MLTLSSVLSRFCSFNKFFIQFQKYNNHFIDFDLIYDQFDCYLPTIIKGYLND